MKKDQWLSEKDYNFIYSNSPRICVDLVLKAGKTVFLTRRDIQPYKGKYHLPGGKVNFRESISNAIHRIAKREIGVDIKIKHLLGFMEFPREVQSGNKRHSISLAFLITSKKKFHGTNFLREQIHPVHYKFLKGKKLIK
jgi:ADP-ribose pyrophosphatase YjhB (NUDIX family)